MRPPKLTEAGKEQIRQTALARADIPSDRALAVLHGISVTWVQKLMRKFRREIKRDSDTELVRVKTLSGDESA